MCRTLCKITHYTEIGNLAINNVDQHDGGTYSCKADDIQPLLMTIVFRGTQSKLEKAQSNEAPLERRAL
jgi:hypothetical protein